MNKKSTPDVAATADKPYRIVKRLMDLVLSFVSLLILLVPMLIVLIIDAVDLGGNPIFTQNRIGRGGKPFRIYKIRTMRRDTPRYLATGEISDPDRYITRVGRILRKLSIDELPQLLNILIGDMSIVGPRPLIPEEKGIHAMREKAGVYSLRPGMTGLAQINGRDTVLADEKVYWDTEYLRHFSFGQDLRIIFHSFIKVLAADGVQEGAPAAVKTAGEPPKEQ